MQEINDSIAPERFASPKAWYHQHPDIDLNFLTNPFLKDLNEKKMAC